MSSVASMMALTGSLRGEEALAGAGAYLSIGSSGSALDCNLSTGFSTNGMSIVVVVRPSSDTFQPFIYFEDSGSLTTSQAFGVPNNNSRMGLFEADTSPTHGRTFNNSFTDTWVMVAASINGAQYNNLSVLTVDGVTGQAGSGSGSGASNNVDDVSTFTVHLGSPNTSFAGSSNFDIAFARIYNRNLTDAQSTRIWDHWAANNAALYTENGQTSPTYTAGTVDYVTGLYAEWDFAKMASSSLQTTQGSAGTVTATLVGNATFVP